MSAKYLKKSKQSKYSRFGQSSKNKNQFGRINFLTGVFIIFITLIIVRLFSLQVLQHSFYEALAEGQHAIYQKLLPKRGEIFVQDHWSDKINTIATNIDLNLVYAIPKQIEDPEKLAETVAPYLDLSAEEILPRLSKKDDIYEPLKHNVPDEKWEAIKALNLPGLDATEELSRFYPEGESFSHVLGFVGYQDDQRVGQYGLEGYFNKELAGQQGFLKAEQDAAGRWITIGEKLLEEAQDGDNLVLTLDYSVQFYACEKLAEAVQRHGASEGTVIIMNPKTGAIITMCNAPVFDPNSYSQTEDIGVFINSAVSDQYEPGSVFKSITMAAALDAGKVGPTSTYNDEGQVKIGSYTIRNFDYKAYGTMTMTEVLENSLNTGAIYAAQQLGNESFNNYVQKFGFGTKTDIQLEGENPGNISSLGLNKDIYSATASYGQGITVTPLQLITAYSAIANGGKLMKPYIIDKVVKRNGFEVKTDPEMVRQVISTEAARTLGAMLVSVVNKGHAKGAQVPGYFIAGKTGTAQIARKDGVGYESGRHNDTFVGFAPVDDPAFVVLTKINDPKDVSWAEGSAVPLFGDIAKFLLDYYQIPPDETE